MELKKISLNNYRNYHHLDLDFSPKLNVFLGENAQGKTNLLESIYMLSLARSHRTNNEKEVIQWEKEHTRIEGNITKKHGEINLTMFLSAKGKKTKINGLEQKKLSDYIGNLNVILFAPEDLNLVKGSPQNRRKFLDIEIGQINANYLYQLSVYQTVLKQRNHYFKKMLHKKETDTVYLDVLSEQLARAGSHVLFERLNFVDKLENWANNIHDKLSYSKELLTIQYKGSFKLPSDVTVENIYQVFLEELKKNEKKDIQYLTTSVGPHRDDLIFLINNRNVQTFGSQGQQRTTALSIKLAEIELINDEIGEYPILLLDDVLSELDDARQVHLMEFIDDKLQTFLTTTSIKHLEKKLTITPKTFYINNGEVERIRDEFDR